MLKGLWKLTWIELKIFLREPMGAFFTLGFPLVIFMVFGRVYGNETGVMTRSMETAATTSYPGRRERHSICARDTSHKDPGKQPGRVSPVPR